MMVTEDEFVEAFVRFWREELEAKGLKYLDDPNTNVRTLARVIAKTVVPLLPGVT